MSEPWPEFEEHPRLRAGRYLSHHVRLGRHPYEQARRAVNALPEVVEFLRNLSDGIYVGDGRLQDLAAALLDLSREAHSLLAKLERGS